VYTGAHGKTMMQRELSRRQLLACLAEESEDELAYAIRDLIIESIATSPFKRDTQISFAPFSKEMLESGKAALHLPAEWVINFNINGSLDKDADGSSYKYYLVDKKDELLHNHRDIWLSRRSAVTCPPSASCMAISSGTNALVIPLLAKGGALDNPGNCMQEFDGKCNRSLYTFFGSDAAFAGGAKEKNKHDLLILSFMKVQEALQGNRSIVNLVSGSKGANQTIACERGVYPASEGTTPWMHLRLEPGKIAKSTWSVYSKEGIGLTGMYWGQ